MAFFDRTSRSFGRPDPTSRDPGREPAASPADAAVEPPADPSVSTATETEPVSSSPVKASVTSMPVQATIAPIVTVTTRPAAVPTTQSPPSRPTQAAPAPITTSPPREPEPELAPPAQTQSEDPEPKPEPEPTPEPEPKPTPVDLATSSSDSVEPTLVVPAIVPTSSSGFATFTRPSTTFTSPTFATNLPDVATPLASPQSSTEADPVLGSSVPAAAIAVPLVLGAIAAAVAAYVFRRRIRAFVARLRRDDDKHASHAWDGLEPKPDDWEFFPAPTSRRDAAARLSPRFAIATADLPAAGLSQPSAAELTRQTVSPRSQVQLPATAFVPLPRTPKTPPIGAAPALAPHARDDDAASQYSSSSWRTSMPPPPSAGQRSTAPPVPPMPSPIAPPPTAAAAIGHAVVRFLEPVRERIWGPAPVVTPPQIRVSTADEASSIYGDDDDTKLAYARPVVRSFDGANSAYSSSDARGSDRETLGSRRLTMATAGMRSSMASDGSARSSQRWSRFK